MKLIIQICCLNEEDSLPVTLSALPRKVIGFDQVEWLVVDDGSTDNTVNVAKSFGVDHIVSNSRNYGLANAFMLGVNTSLKVGADVIVNTDADNQYNAEDIEKLTSTILNKGADYVIGIRPIDKIPHFSIGKKIAQKIGSWVVRMASKTTVADATSGFRAMNRKFAHRIMVFSNYTYTIETIIQAGRNNCVVTTVPIKVNPDLRPSRLLKSNLHYIKLSIITIVRIFSIYRPFRFFTFIGSFFFSLGFLLGVRFLYLYYTGDGFGHTQSLILAAVLIGMGFQTFVMAFVVDSIAANRKIMEEVRIKLRENDCTN